MPFSKYSQYLVVGHISANGIKMLKDFRFFYKFLTKIRIFHIFAIQILSL